MAFSRRESIACGGRTPPFLTKQQKRDIFYDNAARFLRLSNEDIARHHSL